jgi:toxin YoeB
MEYELKLTEKALDDIERHKKSGQKSILFKLDVLLNELTEHPYTGTGKPEPLKHEKNNKWSRRITQKHRLIYEVKENIVLVEVLSAWGHYDDK